MKSLVDRLMDEEAMRLWNRDPEILTEAALYITKIEDDLTKLESNLTTNAIMHVRELIGLLGKRNNKRNN